MGELSRIFESPFTVAIAAMCIPIVAIISGIWSKAHADRLHTELRMAMIARGIPLPEIEAALKSSPAPGDTTRVKDPLRSLGNARRAAVVLISVGLGLIAFFNVLSAIIGVRAVLAGAAAGLIPLLIGLGFVVDYHLQKRELARFGLEIDLPPPKTSHPGP